jgi:hypothetical protein
MAIQAFRRSGRAEVTDKLYTSSLPFEKMYKRKVRLKISAASRQIVKLSGQSFSAQCAACGREVETLTRSQAGEILEIGEQGLAELIAAGRIHAIQTASGSLRICKESLFSR